MSAAQGSYPRMHCVQFSLVGDVKWCSRTEQLVLSWTVDQVSACLFIDILYRPLVLFVPVGSQMLLNHDGKWFLTITAIQISKSISEVLYERKNIFQPRIP